MSKAKVFDWRKMPEFGAFSFVIFVFLYAPLIILIVFAFNASDRIVNWQGFTLHWFDSAIHNVDMRRAAMNSVIVAITATLASTLVAVPAAVALARGRRMKGQSFSEGLLALPLVAPEIVTAVVTLIFFSAIGLRLGLGNLIIAHTVFCIPFAMMPMRARLKEMSTDIEDAARDLYANEREVFFKVTLPNMMPAVISGATLALVVSLDDFMISMMVAEAGSTTLPVYLYGMVRLGVTPEVNAASTLLLAVSVIAVVTAYLLSPRQA